jgi:hypothetical protein
VPSIDWINEKAQMWMRYYNSVRVHRRHGLTRWAKWMEITQQQLRLVDADLARALLTHAPETPKVDRNICVRFDGRTWNVGSVPGVLVGEKVQITFNPFDRSVALVVQHDTDGHELLIPVPEAVEGEHGFSADAARIGREFKSPADTQAVANRKLVERIAMGADTDEAAAAARKAKALPFGGKHDPYKHHEQSLPAVAMLPRKGTELAIGASVPQAAPEVLTHFEAAKALAAKGIAMSPELVGTLKSLHPEGVPETELDALAARLTVRAGLRVVGGGQ